jgi:hypothetical protein
MGIMGGAAKDKLVLTYDVLYIRCQYSNQPSPHTLNGATVFVHVLKYRRSGKERLQEHIAAGGEQKRLKEEQGAGQLVLVHRMLVLTHTTKRLVPAMIAPLNVRMIDILPSPCHPLPSVREKGWSEWMDWLTLVHWFM